MTGDSGEVIRQALLDAPVASEAARERFERQAREILEQRLTGAGRAFRLAGVAVLTLAGLYCAWAAAFAAFWGAAWAAAEIPLEVRLVGAAGCGAGALLLLTGAGYAYYEYRSGAVAPRRVQKTAVAIRYACLFLVCALLAMHLSVRQLSPPKAQGLTVFAVFLWTLGLAFSLAHVERWHHEDLMLEQKRGQLAGGDSARRHEEAQ